MNNQDKTPQGITPNLPLWSYQLQQDSKLAVRTRKDWEINLITRALKDEDFRKGLVANPKAAVEKEIGAKLPEKLEIKVLEETEDTLYMVLPYNPYEGIYEDDLKALVGMTYEDVAQWVLQQQRNSLLDEESSVIVIARAWRDEKFKQELLENPKIVVEKEWRMAIPENFEFKVLEESLDKLYLSLPHMLNVSYVDINNPPDPDVRQLLVAGSGGQVSTGVRTCVNCPPITCLTGVGGKCTCV